MSALQVESFDQDLRVLVLTDNSVLTKLIEDYFTKQHIGVETLFLYSLDLNKFVRQTLSNHNYYKIVVVAGFSQPCSLESSKVLALIDLINTSNKPTILISRFFEELSDPDPLFDDWEHWSSLSHLFIKLFQDHCSQCKLLLAKDIIDPSLWQTPPLFSFIQAVKNGFLLDPLSELSPIDLNVFFNNIKKELLRPEKKNYLVGGATLATETLLLKLSLRMSQLYNTELKTINPRLQLKPRPDIENNAIAVTVIQDVESLVINLAETIETKNLITEPEKIAAVINNRSLLLTSPTKPFKQRGENFAYEPPINKTATFLEESQEQQVGEFVTKTPVTEKKDLEINEKNEATAKNWQDAQLSKKAVSGDSAKTDGANNKRKPPLLISVDKKDLEQTQDQDSLDTTLSRMFSERRTKQKTNRRSEKIGIYEKIKRKSKNKRVIFLAGLIVISVGVVVGSSLALLALNYRSSQVKTRDNLQAFIDKDYEKVNSMVVLGWQARLLDKLFSLQLIDNSVQLSALNQQLLVTSKMIRTQRLAQAETMKQVLAIVPQGKAQLLEKSELIEQIDLNNTQAELLVENLLAFQAEISDFNTAPFSQEINGLIITAEEEVRKMLAEAAAISTVSKLHKDILALDGKKTYYLILQDPQELRPTGGFIQAIAQLVFEEGRLVDYQTFSTNWIDSLVLGGVDANEEMRYLLGETRVHLRDANWDPDLSSSSKQISWFLKEALNQPVDGVFAINYHQVREALVILGEINLEKQQETITAQNLFNRLEQNAPEDKKQTKDSFHTELLSALINRIRASSHQDLMGLQSLLLQGLRDQQIALYFSDEVINQQFSQLGWGGGLIKPNCPSRFSHSCKIDYIYQVEANIGINKVNQYVTTRVNHNIEITESDVKHIRRIFYNNRAHSTTWPLGNYKAYVRFFLNHDSQIESLQINGQDIPDDQLRKYSQHGKKVLGGTIVVEPNKELELTLKYSSPHQIQNGDSYFFFEQPQPGLTRRLSTIGVNHHQDLVPELISPFVEINQNKIVVTSGLSKGFVAIKFSE